MIEFDDAGIGCTILGEVYVARRVETDEMVTAFIHVKEKEAKPTIEILYEMLTKFQPDENEEIILCRGNVFNGFEQFLKKKGLNVMRGKIEGITNDLAEERFLQELYNVGLPKTIQLKGKSYATFYQSVMLWYKVFYKGENLIKNPNKKRKPKERDYMMNQVHHHPNLLAILFGMKTEEKLNT